MALSFPFFSGWNNWTPAEIDAAVETSGRVVQSLWENWPAAESSEHVEVYNVNVRLLLQPVDPMCSNALSLQRLIACTLR